MVLKVIKILYPYYKKTTLKSIRKLWKTIFQESACYLSVIGCPFPKACDPNTRRMSQDSSHGSFMILQDTLVPQEEHLLAKNKKENSRLCFRVSHLSKDWGWENQGMQNATISRHSQSEVEICRQELCSSITQDYWKLCHSNFIILDKLTKVAYLFLAKQTTTKTNVAQVFFKETFPSSFYYIR